MTDTIVQPEGFSAKVETQEDYDIVVETFAKILSQRGKCTVRINLEDLKKGDNFE